MVNSNNISKPFAIPRLVLKQKLIHFLNEDLINGDLSSGFIPETASAKAIIISKTPGIVAGLEEATILFQESGLDVQEFVKDGDTIENNQKIMEISGNLRNILMIYLIQLLNLLR